MQITKPSFSLTSLLERPWPSFSLARLPLLSLSPKKQNRLPGQGDEDELPGTGSSHTHGGGGGLGAFFAQARRRRNNQARGAEGADEAAAPFLAPPHSPPQPRSPPGGNSIATAANRRRNVDAFLSRLYRFHEEGGFTAVTLSRGLNLAAIAFTAAFAATLLLVVRWGALSDSQCLKDDTCDIADVALDFRPLRSWLRGQRPDLGPARVAGALLLLAALGCFFVASAAAAVADVAAALESRAVSEEVLGLSERSLRRASWAEVSRRLVEAQREEKKRISGRGGGGGGGGSVSDGGGDGSDDDELGLDPQRRRRRRPLLGPLGSGCAVLDESLIAARIMRRDNYLIALLAEGLLPLAPGAWLLTPDQEQEQDEAQEQEGGRVGGGTVRRAWRRLAALSRRALRRVPCAWSLPPSLAASYEWNLRAVLLEPMFVLPPSPPEGEIGEEEGGGGGEEDGGEEGRRRRRRGGAGARPPSPPPVVLSPEATDPAALAARSRRFAALNALAAPFALALLVVLLFMRHAERLYHHPSTAAARDWSRLARWRVREFNELPGALDKRLSRSRAAAERYVAGFPSPASAAAAKFVAFVAGSGAALLLLVAVLHDGLLERSLWGRHLVWWIALLGIVLAGSRSWAEGGGAGGGGGGGGAGVAPGRGGRGGGTSRRLPAPPPAPARFSSPAAFASSSFRSSSRSSDFSRDDQEAALLEVASFTHFFPRRWRGRAGSRATQQEFEEMFPLALTSLLLSEVAALVAVPLMLWRDLPRAAAEICAFVEENTVRLDGVGDVCSLSAFRGGGPRAGAGTGGGGRAPEAPSPAAAAADDLSASALALLSRSREGKLEKSLLSFAAEYPGWRPDGESRALLEAVARKCRGGRGQKKGGGGGGSAGGASLVGSILLRGGDDGEEEGTTEKRRGRGEWERGRRDTAFGGSAELQADEEEEGQEEEEEEEEEVEPCRASFLLPGDIEGDTLAAAHLALLASLDLGDGDGEREGTGRSGGRERGSGRRGGGGRAAGVVPQQPAAPPPPPPPQPQQQQRQQPPPAPPPPIRFPASTAAASPRVAQWGFGAFGEEQELASLSPSPSPASFPSSAPQRLRPGPAAPASSAPAFPLPPPPPPSGALSQQLRAVVASAVPPPVAFDAPLSFSSSAARQQQQQQRPPPSPPAPSSSSFMAAAVPIWLPPPMLGENGSDEEAAGGGGGGAGGFLSALAGGGEGRGADAVAATTMAWAATPPDLDEPALDAAADPWGVSEREHQ